MFSNARATISVYAHEHVKRLKMLHHYFPDKTEYPRDKRYNSAIYDVELEKIFSTLENSSVDFDKEIYRIDDYIHFVKHLDDYYLGAMYLFIEIPENRAWHQVAITKIMLFGLIGLFIFGIFGLFFVKILIKPMKDSVDLLDNFIKDTTHELNTPISAILANVEMIDRETMTEKDMKKINRINIAAKTVSHLYQDLTFLSLGHNRSSNDEWIDLKLLIEDRANYFYLLAESKKISCNLDLKESKLFIDSAKIARIIDNLISNAIKYNRRSGDITIVLRKDYLVLTDTGIGMKSKQVSAMFERYSRFSSSEGGFGIGLNIVKAIADEYNLKIHVSSELGKGTSIQINFPKGKSDENS
jgi:two-component system OmpR family sensor kinase